MRRLRAMRHRNRRHERDARWSVESIREVTAAPSIACVAERHR
ncbi:hypothetical protein AZ78_4328 [Lysobacter capsici AZ78]|uniref:Uncharacterized protein n=1 Tax=Lysobacter capsici AZ78 TaxID=1444315 RepID=A0A120AHW2_9GAMM|nr:hypothetical protein AZ78_4328 [Lysobacter capsici AZ78]